jgi:hypothetical protein
MDQARKTAFVAGILFIITFAASIPAVILYDPILHDPNYVVGAGADSRIFLGALLEFVTGIANIGTAVVLFPILRRQNESIALGYVASRTVESTIIVAGIISLLAIVTLRQGFAASPGDSATLLTVSRSLLAVHGWTFLLGPGLLAGSTGLLLGYLMYRSGLVPRPMALLGLVGGPLIFASGIAVLFGRYDQLSPVSFAFSLPEILWEASLGIYLTVRGFRPSPILAGRVS